MAVQEPAQAVALNGALADLATDDNTQAAAQGALVPWIDFQELGFGPHRPQDHPLPMESPPLLVDPIKDKTPPQPVFPRKRHGLGLRGVG